MEGNPILLALLEPLNKTLLEILGARATCLPPSLSPSLPPFLPSSLPLSALSWFCVCVLEFVLSYISSLNQKNFNATKGERREK